MLGPEQVSEKCSHNIRLLLTKFFTPKNPEEDTFARSWVLEMKVGKGRQALSSKWRAGRLP